MYVSWRWISEFVDTTDVDPNELALRFTLSVAEIEGVHAFGAGLDGVRVAHVKSMAPHPGADKLRLATCDVDGKSVTVVCGAPDLEVGILVPFAPPGVKLPSGIEVRLGSIRGVESPGMLCSEADLGLSDDHGGLLRLDGVDPAEASGKSFVQAAAVRDVLWEIDNKSVTHRPDLWGHRGVAREVAALLDRPLNIPHHADLALGENPPVALTVDDDSHCRRYLCARIDDVVIAPSHVSQRLRLRSLGVRPISNVVDATNLVMLETGNPLHAFDARQLRGDAIIVRQATAGEELVTLDEQTRVLTENDCVIADSEGPVALAGVMGGADSEIKDDTTSVILEAAAFDGVAIRKTASRLGMRTESSARFEKHLDPETAEAGARSFLATMLRCSPGCRVTSALIDAGRHVDNPPTTVVIETSGAYIRSRLGVGESELSDTFIDRTLAALEFDVRRDGDELSVTVPTFRAGRDVGIAEDIVEEIGRVYGYDHIRSATPAVPNKPPHMPAIKLMQRQVRAACVRDAGLHELVLYSFDNEPFRARTGIGEQNIDGAQRPRLGLRNTLSSDSTHMRRTLASGVIAALEDNLLHGTGNQPARKGLRVGVFEIGRVFLPGQATGDDIDLGVPAAALAGDQSTADWLALMTGALREGTESAAENATPLPLQPKRLAIAFGQRLGGGADGASDMVIAPADVTRALFQRAVAAINAAVARCGRPAASVSRDAAFELTTPASGVDDGVTWLHPARFGAVVCEGRRIGVISAVHPLVRNKLEVPAEVVVAEIDLDELLRIPRVDRKGVSPPRFPATSFDVTLDASPSTRVAALQSSLRDAAVAAHSDVIDDVLFLDEFSDGQRRALTFRVVCRHGDRTLTDAEVVAVRKTVETVTP